MTDNNKHISKAEALGGLLRFERTLMAAIITGAAAFAAGAGIASSLWMALSGWCAAVGGFFLGSVLRDETDKKAAGVIPKSLILILSLIFIISAFAVSLSVKPLALIPLGIILLFVILLTVPVFRKPLIFALIIGLLHALHLLMGSMAGTFTLTVVLPVFVVFFAIVGARGIIDIRNFPKDLMTRKQTLPKRFGLTATVKLAIAGFLIAYGLAIGTYFIADFSLLYLFPVAILVITGLVCIFLFVKRAGPAMAQKLTPFFTVGTVLLICLALILGSL